MIKKIFKFIAILLPWFLSSLLPINNFIDTIYTPIFTPPKWAFPIIWSILYILISISIYLVFNRKNKEYLSVLIINYIFNQLFNLIFFTFNNLFLSFLDCLIIFITSVILFNETKKIKKEASYFLLPYILFSLFATILSLTIFIMNL